ncbi:hypothetical protein TSH58p_12905 [Azospirillum sp. TSH58]|uniref:hypothetical protein n=1 Tax=Azospirillum sp. TSH58 TaxID=664962 RepID=UPI000D60016D|nr:hypothetical protein [Azospirillum sp. TSH58]AWJ84348.1 hypothetical protein TSH58p_12905 [Azospirillum sp. TSH58]PWC68383.1 hypothetical protein TSH58_17360 [Azospirillum sp. TSH58]
MKLLSRFPSLFQIAQSAVLLLSALFELLDTMLEDFIGTGITTAHGLFLFAAGKMIKEWLEVRKEFSETREKVDGARGRETASPPVG